MGSSVLNKLENILRLAEGGDGHEAANAAAKAKAIADKYGIALELLKQKGSKAYSNKIINFVEYYNAPFFSNLNDWEMVLSRVVAENNGCRVFLDTFNGEPCLNIFGHSNDIDVVETLFSWLRSQVAMVILSQGNKGDRWLGAFTLGVVHQIGKRMREEETRTKNQILSSVGGCQEAISKFENRLNLVDEFILSERYLIHQMENKEILNTKAFKKGMIKGEKIDMRNKKYMEENNA